MIPLNPLEVQLEREDASKPPRFDPLQVQLDDVSDSAPGTCQWIYKRKEYLDWRQASQSPDNVLIVLADPGLGKTVLAKSIAIELENKGESVVAFFCKKNKSGRETASSILASVIYRLFCENQTLGKYVTESRFGRDEGLSFSNLWELFVELTCDRHLKLHTFIVDALDECEPTSQQQIYQALSKSAKKLGSRFLFTARPELYEQGLAAQFPHLYIESDLVSQDVTTYLDYELKAQGIKNLLSGEMIVLLKQNIEAGSEGMFLIITCRLEEFSRAYDDPDFETTPYYLRRFFGRTFGRFRDYFGSMVDALTQLEGSRIEMAISILDTLLASQARLTADQLTAALQFSARPFTTYEAYQSLESKQADIFREAKILCGPLLRKRPNEEGYETISIVHPAVRNFLEDDGDPNSSDPRQRFLARVNTEYGHTLMARACLRFLMLPEIKDINRAMLNKYPFLLYSLVYWPVHVRKSGRMVLEYQELLGSFLTPDSAAYREWAIFWARVKNIDRTVAAPEEPQPVSITLVEHELVNVVDLVTPRSQGMPVQLLGQPIDLDAKDSAGRTAVLVALMTGCGDIVPKLLDLGASPAIADNAGVTPLHLATLLESEPLMENLVEKGATVDAETTPSDSADSESPLFWSIGESVKTFELLLNLGAQRYTRSNDGWSVLHEAALRGKLDIVQVIRNRKLIADVNYQSHDGWTAVAIAAGAGKSLEITRHLVNEHDADVNLVSRTGQNALYEAADHNNIEIASFLLPLTRDINASSQGWTALCAAACDGHTEMVRLLLGARPELDATTKDGRSALLIATENKHPLVARLLIEAGANINLQDETGDFPLFRACINEQLEIVIDLLAKDADSRILKEGLSPLHMAAWCGHFEIVRRLVAARAPKNDIDEVEATAGYTPLLAAIRQNHPIIAKHLISVGANVHKKFLSDWTCLHLASSYTNDEQLFELLVNLAHEDEISALTNGKSSALHFAAEKAFLRAMKLLIDKGADTVLRTNINCTALHCAARSGNSEAVELLLNFNCRPDAQDNWGWTALHVACKKCDAPTVKRLMNITNWRCRRRSAGTPLGIAAYNSNLDAMKVLLENGMPVTMTTNDGWTPLHEAAQSGSEDMVNIFLGKGADITALSSTNKLPILVAYGHQTPSLINRLRPMDSELIRKIPSSLDSYFHEASKFSLSEVKWLAEHKLQPAVKNSFDITPLMFAAEYDQQDILEYLLERSDMQPLINTRSLFSGVTALSLAATSCSPKCIESLVQKGANPESVNYAGLCAFDYAKRDLASLLSLVAADGFQAYERWCKKEDPGTQVFVYQTCKLVSWFRSLKSKDDSENDGPVEEHARATPIEKTLEVGSDDSQATTSGKDLVHTFETKVATTSEARVRGDIPPEVEEKIQPGYNENPEVESIVEPQLQSEDKHYAFDILGQLLLLLDDNDNAATAIERLFGPPSSEIRSWVRCSHCHRSERAKTFFCKTCVGQNVCVECKDKCSQEKVRGCRGHSFLEVPRPSWFTRDSKDATEDGLTERQWLTALSDKYEALKDDNFDASVLPPLITDHDASRPDVFDLCRLDDANKLFEHIRQFPRDIALRNASGDTVVTETLSAVGSDDEGLSRLQYLAMEGAIMLVRNSKASSVQIACEKRFPKSLAFILEQYDGEFDKVDDGYSSTALDLMIEMGWEHALRAAIDRHFDWAAHGRFSSLQHLPLMGLTDNEIVDLLTESRRDNTASSLGSLPESPWIDFRQPKCEDVPQPNNHGSYCVHGERVTEITERAADDPQIKPVRKSYDEDDSDMEYDLVDDSPPGYHTRITTGPYASSSSTATRIEPNDSDLEYELDDHNTASYVSESPSVTESAAMLCGLGGVFPHGPGNATFTIANKETAEVILKYSADSTVSDLEEAAMSTLLQAGNGLLQAMSDAQKAELCCNAFTILHETDELTSTGHPVLRLSGIAFETVIDFVRGIQDASRQKSRPVPRNSLRKASQAAKEVLEQCHLNYSGEKADFAEDIECCSLTMQLLCIGFILFLGGHLFRTQLPILTTHVSRFVLSGVTGSRRIVVEARDMACVGQMLGDKVFAFALRNPLGDTEELTPTPSNESYLLARSNDLLELWGPANCIYKKDANAASTESLAAVDIRQGRIALTGASDCGHRLAHWSPSSRRFSKPRTSETQTEVPSKTHELEQSARMPFKLDETLLLFSIQEILLIGALPVNTRCRIDFARTFANAPPNMIVPLDTYDSYWELETRQIGIQLSAQWAALTLGIQEGRRRGLTKKEAVVNSWNNNELRVLNEPWGVLFSICTGFATRVPLRQVIGEVLEEYLFNVDPMVDGQSLPDNWAHTVETLKMVMKGTGLGREEANKEVIRYLIYGMGKRRKRFVRAAISFVLQHLIQTGVNAREGTFKIAWANRNDPFQSYRFSCSRDHAEWTMLLQDSKRIATFAVATRDCLVTDARHGIVSSCRCRFQRPVTPTRVKLLHTRIVPLGPGSAHWRPDDRTQYILVIDSSERPDLMCLLEKVGARTGHQHRYLIIFDFGRGPNILLGSLRRLLLRTGRLMEHHSTRQDAVAKRVNICPCWEWYDMNNIRP